MPVAIENSIGIILYGCPITTFAQINICRQPDIEIRHAHLKHIAEPVKVFGTSQFIVIICSNGRSDLE